MTTCLENLEILGNLTAVSEMSGILLKIREMSGKILSGKSCLQLFIVNCIFLFVQVFSTSVTLNMPSAVNFTLSGEFSPCKLVNTLF